MLPLKSLFVSLIKRNAKLKIKRAVLPVNSDETRLFDSRVVKDGDETSEERLFARRTMTDRQNFRRTKHFLKKRN